MAYIGSGISRFNTADELTVTGDAVIDTTTLVVDSTNNRVGVLTASPATALDVTGTVTADGLTVDGSGVVRLNPSSGDDFLTIQQGGTQAVITADSTAGAGNLVFRTTSAGSDTDTMLLAANGDISFYASDGTTQGLFWDASTQRLGLGTTAPSSIFHTEENTTGASIVRHKNTSNTSGAHSRFILQNGGTSGGDALINLDTQASGSRFTLGVDRSANKFVIANADKGSFDGSDEALVITSGGSVGIGTSPSSRLHVKGDAYTALTLDGTAGGQVDFYRNGSRHAQIFTDGTDGDIVFRNNTVQERMRIDGATGNVGIGTSSPSMKLHIVEGSSGVSSFNASADDLLIERNSNAGLTIASPNTNSGNIAFADPQSANAGLLQYSHSSNHMGFWTNAAERMRIDSSGNVGIGTSSPTADLHISYGSGSGLLIEDTTNSPSVKSVITSGNTESYFGATSNHPVVFLQNNTERMRISSGNVGIGTASPSAKLELNNGGAGSLVTFTDGVSTNFNFSTSGTVGYFGTDAGGTSLALKTTGAERMRIDASGMVLIGQSASTIPGIGNTTAGIALRAEGVGAFSVNDNPVAYFNRNTSDGTSIQFHRQGNPVGYISVTTTGTTYNTTSDIRLKTDIEPLVATDKLMAMNPVSYAWKVDPDGPRSMGFIAQEMQEVMPEAISTGDDDDAMMSMDYGRITPILVSALQDAHRKIEDLESRIAAMESSNE